MAENLVHHLKEAGYRLTTPRLAVLEVIQSAGGYLSPAEVLSRGRELCPTLSRATVYRTLDLLTELGLMRPVYLRDGAPRLACIDDGHHHLICLACGVAIPFDQCVVGDLIQTLANEFGFQIKSHMLELYGLCKECHE
jgi:Fe2+ or Zn2+ uptake regulation protein